jgi:hypothetical protein
MQVQIENLRPGIKNLVVKASGNTCPEMMEVNEIVGLIQRYFTSIKLSHMAQDVCFAYIKRAIETPSSL